MSVSGFFYSTAPLSRMFGFRTGRISALLSTKKMLLGCAVSLTFTGSLAGRLSYRMSAVTGFAAPARPVVFDNDHLTDRLLVGVGGRYGSVSALGIEPKGIFRAPHRACPGLILPNIPCRNID